MKRVFTFLCALVLLLSCFSGMAVSATEAEPVAPVTASAATVTDNIEDIEMMEYDPFPDQNTPKTYGAALTHKALENSMSDALKDYLHLHFGNCEKTFSLEQFKIPASQWEDLRYIIWYEMPKLFHVYSLGCGSSSDGYLTTVRAGYRPHADTAAEYKTCLNKMLAGAEYLLQGVKGNDSLSDVDKALILHDRLAVWTEYDLENVDSATAEHKIFAAYSALGEGLSVCQGYAMAYMYLLEQVGIESDLCSSDKLWHSWNIVYIDGVPYYTDVTWDDPTNDWPDSSPYFDDYGRVLHSNFMRSYDGIWSTNHTATDFPKVSAGTKYDSAWWQCSNTSIELMGDRLYYIDNTNGALYLRRNGGGPELVCQFNSANPSFVRLTSAGYLLVVGDVWDVKTLDLSNGALNTPAKATDYKTNSYIQGLKYEKGKLTIQVCSMNENWPYRYNVNVRAKLAIAKQPASVAAANNATVKTSVFAVGDGLQYAWYFKDPGSTSYSLSSITTNTYSTTMNSWRSGRQVYCVVSDQYGNFVQSNTVTLSASNPLKITAQPKSATAASGQTVKTTVTATGDGLKYAWYFKDPGKSFSKSSITTNTYSTTMNEWRNGRQVYCVVSDKHGNSLQTNTVTLALGAPLKITAQPKNAVAPNGQQVKTTITATGDGLKYAWYFCNAGSTTYAKSSLTGNSYYVTAKSTTNGRKVYCIVSDKYGNSVKSNVVTLYMGNPAKITVQPKNAAAPNGQQVKTTITATGDGLKYAWYICNPGSTTYAKSSLTGNAYYVTAKATTTGRKVYCIVTDKYGNSVKSNVVTLYMGNPAKITKQPVNVSGADGVKVTTTLTATGDGLKYAWYFCNAGSTTYSKSSLTGNAYYVTMKSTINGRKVYCIVTDKYGTSVKSNVVTLTRKSVATIVTQPTNAAVPNGSTVKTSLQATGEGLTYTWYYKNKGASGYTKSSITTNTYSTTMKSTADGRQVYCIVKDKYGNSVKSNVVTLRDSKKLITDSWKATKHVIPSGTSISFTKSTVTIKSDSTVTLKISSNSEGYSVGTFSYKMKFTKQSGNTIYYAFTNSVQTLTATYSFTTNQLTVHIPGDAGGTFKIVYNRT